MRVFSLLILLSLSIYTVAQDNRLVVYTAIPTAELNTNSRIGGFADIGCVSSSFYPEAGLFQNPALLSANGENAGINITYMPLLRRVVKNMDLKSVNLFLSLDSKNAFGYSYSVFSLGEIMMMDEYGNNLYSLKPRDMFHKFSYSRVISNTISLGLGLKYINSYENENIGSKTFALDIGFDYHKGYVLTDQWNMKTNIGASLNNLGPKISYPSELQPVKAFQLSGLKSAVLLNPEYQVTPKFTLDFELACQLEKDLIPSIPVYASTDNTVIIKGKDPDISSFKALYQSFYDSPYGINGELKEIRYKIGIEIRANYDNKIYVALRSGSSVENYVYSTDVYATKGIGVGLFGFTLDYSSLKAVRLSNPNDQYALTLGFRAKLDGSFFRF